MADDSPSITIQRKVMAPDCLSEELLQVDELSRGILAAKQQTLTSNPANIFAIIDIPFSNSSAPFLGRESHKKKSQPYHAL